MNMTNREYRVGVRFDQVQVGHLAIFATNAEEAKTKALTMMENHKNPEVLDVIELEAKNEQATETVAE